MFYGERFVTRYAGTGRGMYTRNIILKWEWGRGFAGARASTFTRINGNVSCLCDKRLQNLHIV